MSPKTMVEFSVRYLAGLFDGDGSVGVYWSGKAFRPRVQIKLNHAEDLLMSLKETYGGGVSPIKHENPNHQDGHKWVLETQKGVADFLTLLVPHLIEKKDQAEKTLWALEDWKERAPIATPILKQMKQDPCLEAPRLLSDEYVAGLFDAEGFVGFHKVKSFFYPRIVVGMACKPLIDSLQLTCGGLEYSKKVQQAHHKPFWTWELHAKEAVQELLTKIQPFSIVKRTQIDATLAALADWTDLKLREKTFHDLRALKRPHLQSGAHV